jgi:hypothetical protein
MRGFSFFGRSADFSKKMHVFTPFQERIRSGFSP